jgi:hypothetical protein
MVIDSERKLWEIKVKTIELRSLLDGKPKKINISIEIETAFNIWMKKLKKNKIENPELLQAFYAGYILSNPIVREKYRKSEELHIETN